MKSPDKIFSLLLIGLLLHQSCAQGNTDNQTANAITVESLKETEADQRRDLSIPESRIVINPFSFRTEATTTQVAFSNRPSMPLNLAYLSTERVGRRLDNALMVYRNISNGTTATYTEGWVASLKANEWQTDAQNTQLATVDTGLRFSINSDAVSAAYSMISRRPIIIDIDKTPSLILSIPNARGAWSLKILDENSEEKTIRPDSFGNGTYEFNIKELTGWSGSKRLRLILYLVLKDSYVEISDVRYIGITSDQEPEYREASTYETAWQPNELPFNATYPDGSTLSGTDFFYDKNTVIRKMYLNTNNSSNPYFILSGYYNGKVVSRTNDIITFDNGTFSYAFKAQGIDVNSISFYKSREEMKYQVNELDEAPYSGFWCAKIDAGIAANQDIITAMGFSYKNDNEPDNILNDRVNAPFTSNNTNTKYEARKSFWNDFLASIPQPSVFDIETVDAKGVTPEQVKSLYYKAWVFVAQNLLEPDPVNFPYPQIVGGKASVWDESDDKAPYSGTWDSLLGMQFYGLINPQAAWDAFEGLMSLTDSEGVIGGESLPSRKAQTAWILYCYNNKDISKLARVYDALERYLNWRMMYPHWIYNSYPDPRLKDAEFVFSAVVDMQYMIEISKLIKGETEAEIWRQKMTDFYQQSLNWFWATSSSYPVQYYNTESKTRSKGNPYWTLTGLHMNLLSGNYVSGTKQLFTDNFKPDENFGGKALGLPKYPDVEYTTFGLFEHKMTTSAEKVIDVCIRDIVRSGGWFSEQYESTGIPYPTGVRPMLFGAMQIIDMIMMKNGFRLDMGDPYIQDSFKGQRSITGIRIGQKTLNISRDDNRKYTISGDYLNKDIEIEANYGDYIQIKEKDPSGINKTELDSQFRIINENSEYYALISPVPQVPFSLRVYGVDGKLYSSNMYKEKETDGSMRIPLSRLEKNQLYLITLSTGKHTITRKLQTL